jgi:hypothetical protein
MFYLHSAKEAGMHPSPDWCGEGELLELSCAKTQAGDLGYRSVVEYVLSMWKALGQFLTPTTKTHNSIRQSELRGSVPGLSKKSESWACWWLTPIILATWETQIWRITIRGQSGDIVFETSISKITSAK